MVYSYKLVTLNKYRLLVHPTLEIFLNSIKLPHLYRAMIRGLAEENSKIVSQTIVLVLRLRHFVEDFLSSYSLHDSYICFYRVSH